MATWKFELQTYYIQDRLYLTHWALKADMAFVKTHISNFHMITRLYVLIMSRTHFKSVWPNGWVFVYELSGSEFESSCSHDH